MTYYAEYKPENVDKFEQMVRVFGLVDTKADLEKISMAFILDMSYARPDILVALGRVEREKGWK